ncbi:glycosyltransferase family 2 protein [Methyloligella sp. 2.7D]|uniref:glycosyltransferase family 2 protein n=1 Tax=unclassified Methyloligella TaxID=2625955 RepID=UPI00157BF0E5|nr:glycosyltransferase family 2 protein [Methyloligella sp. GL2]QKP78085.1 glycosyltransferase family 2 protein [Methyloligella sp. GL2]
MTADTAPLTLSIVIPSYARPDQMALAIRSAAKQPLDNIEIIVVAWDDASLPEDLAGLPNLHVLPPKPGESLVAARNRGMAAAKGAWLIVFDEGDVLLPGSLLRRIRYAEEWLRVQDGLILPVFVCGFVPLYGGRWPGLVRRPRGAHGIEGFAGKGEVAPGAALLFPRAFLSKVGRLDDTLDGLARYDWFLKAALQGADLIADPSIGVVRLPSRNADGGYDTAAEILRKRWAGLPQGARARLLAQLDLALARHGRGAARAKHLARSFRHLPRARLATGSGLRLSFPSKKLAASLAKFLESSGF